MFNIKKIPFFILIIFLAGCLYCTAAPSSPSSLVKFPSELELTPIKPDDYSTISEYIVKLKETGSLNCEKFYDAYSKYLSDFPVDISDWKQIDERIRMAEMALEYQKLSNNQDCNIFDNIADIFFQDIAKQIKHATSTQAIELNASELNNVKNRLLKNQYHINSETSSLYIKLLSNVKKGNFEYIWIRIKGQLSWFIVTLAALVILTVLVFFKLKIKRK